MFKKKKKRVHTYWRTCFNVDQMGFRFIGIFSKTKPLLLNVLTHTCVIVGSSAPIFNVVLLAFPFKIETQESCFYLASPCSSVWDSVRQNWVAHGVFVRELHVSVRMFARMCIIFFLFLKRLLSVVVITLYFLLYDNVLACLEKHVEMFKVRKGGYLGSSPSNVPNIKRPSLHWKHRTCSMCSQ